MKNKSKIFFCLTVTSIIFLAGCSQKINLSTYADYDFLSRGFAKGSTFAIGKSTGESSLLDKQIIQKISFVLQNRGYQVSDIKNADFLINFDYSMRSEVRTEYVEKTSGSTVVTGITNAFNISNNGYSNSQENGTVVATHKVMVPVEVTYYNKSMQISIFTINKSLLSCAQETIWTASANILNKEADLRYSLDYLLAGIFQYFGKNTKKVIHFDVGDKNKNLKEVRDFIVPKKRK